MIKEHKTPCICNTCLAARDEEVARVRTEQKKVEEAISCPYSLKNCPHCLGTIDAKIIPSPKRSVCCGAEVTKNTKISMYPDRPICLNCRKWCYIQT